MQYFYFFLIIILTVFFIHSIRIILDRQEDLAKSLREYVKSDSTKVNKYLGGLFLVSVLLYFLFVKPSSDPKILDRLKNDSTVISSKMNDLHNVIDTTFYKK